MAAVCIRASVGAPPAFLVPEDDLTEAHFLRHRRREAQFFTRYHPFSGLPCSGCPTCGTLHAKPAWWGECASCADDRRGNAE